METLQKIVNLLEQYLNCQKDIQKVEEEKNKLEIKLQKADSKKENPALMQLKQSQQSNHPMLDPNRIRPIIIQNDIERKTKELKALLAEHAERGQELETIVIKHKPLTFH